MENNFHLKKKTTMSTSIVKTIFFFFSKLVQYLILFFAPILRTKNSISICFYVRNSMPEYLMISLLHILHFIGVIKMPCTKHASIELWKIAFIFYLLFPILLNAQPEKNRIIESISTKIVTHANEIFPLCNDFVPPEYKT